MRFIAVGVLVLLAVLVWRIISEGYVDDSVVAALCTAISGLCALVVALVQTAHKGKSESDND
jgi:energy-converting hydrogenase Eha subunit C